MIIVILKREINNIKFAESIKTVYLKYWYRKTSREVDFIFMVCF